MHTPKRKWHILPGGAGDEGVFIFPLPLPLLFHFQFPLPLPFLFQLVCLVYGGIPRYTQVKGGILNHANYYRSKPVQKAGKQGAFRRPGRILVSRTLRIPTWPIWVVFSMPERTCLLFFILHHHIQYAHDPGVHAYNAGKKGCEG